MEILGKEAVKISIQARHIDDVSTCNSPCQQHSASGGWSLWGLEGDEKYTNDART